MYKKKTLFFILKFLIIKKQKFNPSDISYNSYDESLGLKKVFFI